MLKAPLVDCHAHVWKAGMAFAPDAWTRPDYCYTAEDWLADLGTFGAEYGVIAAASLFGTNSDYTLDVLARYPNLRGTAIVDQRIDDEALADLRARGIVGVRLQWFMLDPLPALDPAFCARLREHGLHIHLNIDGDRLIEVAGKILETGVKLVIDHYGWHTFEARLEAPSYRGMLGLLEGGNAWVKLSSGFRRPDRDLPAEYTQDLFARFGAERLLWGSDAPFVGHEHDASYARVVEDFHYAVPDPGMRDALGRSAYNFYFSG